MSRIKWQTILELAMKASVFAILAWLPLVVIGNLDDVIGRLSLYAGLIVTAVASILWIALPVCYVAESDRERDERRRGNYGYRD